MSKYHAALKRAEERMGVFAAPLRVGESVKVLSTVPNTTNAPGFDVADDPNPAIFIPPASVRQIVSRGKPGVPAWLIESQSSRASEQYRIIRTKVARHLKQRKMLLISSPGSGDGKTVSAANIASVFALKERAKVLLIEADLRRSVVAMLLGIESTPGLSDVIAGSSGLSEALVCLQQTPNLFILPAGTPKANPAELLDSARWRALCLSLQKEFDFIIIDAPPVAVVADYELLEAACDGVILVVRPDHTPRKLLASTLEALRKDKFIGVVLNDVPDWFLRKHQQYSQYYE